MCLRTEREYARLAVVVCVCVVEHTDTLRASTDDTRVAVPARRVSSHLGSSRARGSRAPSCASRERVVLVWRVALHLGDNTPRSSNFEKPSKGGSANSRSQCPMQHAYPSALTAVLWLSAGCRLGWTSPAASPPAIKSMLLVASLALNGLDLRRACRRIYAHPAAAPRSVLFD